MKRDDILTKEAQIRQWISEYRPKAFICRQLNCKPLTLDSYLAKLGIAYDGNQGSRGRKLERLKPASDYLYNGSMVGSHDLKLKLIRDGIKKPECESCRASNWLDGSVPLELHHISGDRYDNRLENLQLLCPNCHALTDNHRVKGHKNLTKKPKIQNVDQSIENIEAVNVFTSVLIFDSAESRNRWNKIPLALRQLVSNGDGTYRCQYAHGTCLHCGKLLSHPYQDTYCSVQCSRLASRRAIRPSKEELEKLVWTKSTVQVAKDFGVSDKTIEKWCKLYGIEKPPRGYWAKEKHSKL